MKIEQKIFDKFYTQLNEEQKDAVNSIEGPVMVIAGPGTGKTQIIALRIALILKNTDSSPDNILALTFTESGARAMELRLRQIIGPEAHRIHIHTFHSFCQEVITTFSEKFVFSHKDELIDELESINIIKSILDEGDYLYIKPFKQPHHWVKEILKTIDNIKREDVSPENLHKLIVRQVDAIKQSPDLINKSGKQAGKPKQKFVTDIERLERSKEFSKIYQLYQKKLQQLGLYDFNDLILNTLRQFKKDNELLSYYQEKFLYILADEYQDTNKSQNEILQILSSYDDQPNLFVVGDDEQSIYRFQGAALENMLIFKQIYPSVKIIVLKKNYRSTQTIIDAAHKIISQNSQQIAPLWKLDKNFTSHNQSTKIKINSTEFNDEDQENYFCVKTIQSLLNSGVKASEIAVLYRQHSQADSLIHIFRQLKIPFEEIRSSDILNSNNIAKLILILKIIEKAGIVKDIDSELFTIMHFDFFNIDTIDIYKTNFACRKTYDSYFDFISNSNNYKTLNLRKAEAIAEFFNKIIKLKKLAHNSSFSAFFQQVITETGYYDWLIKEENELKNLTDLNTLFNLIKRLNKKNRHLSLTQFLQYLAELEENELSVSKEEFDPQNNTVKLMTVHRSKGLEFETVFIIHATQSVWDHAKDRQKIKIPPGIVKTVSEELIEEEQRRLFYVAMTRAKKNLYITSATSYPDTNKQEIITSLIDKINSDLIKKIEPVNESVEKKEMLKIKLGPNPISDKTKQFDQYLDEIIAKFVLSPTSLNNYLRCPKYFLYNDLLRIPQAKDFNQSYGTAVHVALEQFFKEFRSSRKLPNVDLLIDGFVEGLKAEVLTDEETTRAKTQGMQTLKKYFDFYHKKWIEEGPPLYCEYNFASDRVMVENVPISGKVDRIQLIDKIANTIRVIDYKTSTPKSDNDIRGLTQNKDRSLLNQVLFYCILAKHDPLFRYLVVATSLDFVTPKQDKFVAREINPTSAEIREMEEIIITTHQKIIDHQFIHTGPQQKNCAYCGTSKTKSLYNQIAGTQFIE